MAPLLKHVPGSLGLERKTPSLTQSDIDFKVTRAEEEARMHLTKVQAIEAALEDTAHPLSVEVYEALSLDHTFGRRPSEPTRKDVLTKLRAKKRTVLKAADTASAGAARERQRVPSKDPRRYVVSFDSKAVRFQTQVSVAKGEQILESSTDAFLIHSQDAKHYWTVNGKVYVTTDDALTAEDVSALAHEASNRRRMQLEKAKSLQAMTRELDTKAKREPIPQDVKVTVWQRDGGRCVECGSNENLEFDHIIPLAMGGANTMRNLQLLCETCNRRKGATLG